MERELIQAFNREFDRVVLASLGDGDRLGQRTHCLRALAAAFYMYLMTCTS